MNSIESALFTRDLFDRTYHSVNMNDAGESLFGVDLYRESECVDDFCSYDRLLNEYADYDMHKMFGLSLQDYLNLTPYEKERILYVAKERAIQIITKQNQIKEEMENASNKK